LTTLTGAGVPPEFIKETTLKSFILFLLTLQNTFDLGSPVYLKNFLQLILNGVAYIFTNIFFIMTKVQVINKVHCPRVVNLTICIISPIEYSTIDNVLE